jgi:acetoacetate decarboxylase
VSEEQRRSTATRGYRASMLDTNAVNKRTSLPRMNICAQSIPNFTTTNRVILFREIITVYSDDHIKPTSFLNAKACSATVL